MKATVCCVLLLAAAAAAYPRSSLREHVPDRDVEEVEPVSRGGSRVPAHERTDSASDESAEGLPVSIGISFDDVRPLGGFGGFGSPRGGPRPIGFFPVRPFIGRGEPADEDSDVDVPSGGGFLHPFIGTPMSGFMSHMAEVMAAMRRQMANVLNRGGSGPDGPDFSKLGNTTSTTKVIDGHVITVNETVIGDGDDVMHVRVIDIHPSESPESAEASGKDGKGSAEDRDKDDGRVSAEDRDKDSEAVEPLASSNEVTEDPARSENDIPMKVGSEVDDLNA